MVFSPLEPPIERIVGYPNRPKELKIKITYNLIVYRHFAEKMKAISAFQANLDGRNKA